MCFSVQVDTDLKKLEERFDAKINEKSFDYFKRMQNLDTQRYRYVYEEDQRVFAKIWAPVICMVRGQRQIRPMRYQLLPSFCDTDKYMKTDEQSGRKTEIKSTYNARIDSLMHAMAWRKPFMRFHAVLPIKRFYEWVPRSGHKAMIGFYSETEQYILAPCLYDNWYSKDKTEIIQSFAIITDEAGMDVRAMGHHRSPINLSEKDMETWLNPEGHTQEQILNILKNPHKSHYLHQWEM